METVIEVIWLPFAFFTAVCEAIKDGLCKKTLKELDFLYVAWVWKAFSLVFLFPYLGWFSFDFLNLNFLIALFVGGTLNFFATLLYIKAIELGDLSSTLPMLSFTPLFLLFTSPLMVGDIPDTLGFIGVLLIFLGSFLLTKTITDGSNLKGSFKGPFYMLGVAFIWSVAANVDKIGIKNSSLFEWAFSIQTLVTILISFIILKKKSFKNLYIVLKRYIVPFVFIGFFTAMGLSCQFFAISSGLVPYVISIKRLSIVFGVLVGGLFFKELHFKVRFVSSLIMFAGVICIVI